MGMEIIQLLTDGKINFYFGEIDKLSGEEHKEAYVNVCSFTMNLLKQLFNQKLKIETVSKINLSIKNFNQIDDSYIIKSSDFFENLEVVFTDIYNSNENEVFLSTGNLFINIYSDPVDIQIYYGNDVLEQKKLKPKKAFPYSIFQIRNKTKTPPKR